MAAALVLFKFLGRFLILLHGTFGMFTVFFYLSNLRVHFITPSYEKPLMTFDDIRARGATVYIPSDLRTTSLVKARTMVLTWNTSK